MSKTLYTVDGRRMTIEEIADMLGVSSGALRTRKSVYGGCSYQVIVDMYRQNRIGSRNDRWVRHMVEGEWITIAQAAERLGLKPKTLRNWRYKQRNATGVMPTLAETVAHFSGYRTGEKKRFPGKVPERHWVKGEYMTYSEAARKYKTSANALRMIVSRHKCSLNAAVARMEARRTKRAEREILSILMGE